MALEAAVCHTVDTLVHAALLSHFHCLVLLGCWSDSRLFPSGTPLILFPYGDSLDSHEDCRLHQYIYGVDATSKKKKKRDEGGPWVRPTHPGHLTLFQCSG